MEKMLAALALAGLMMIAIPSVVSAAPNDNAAHVAACATQMGGQSVAACAQTMGLLNCLQNN